MRDRARALVVAAIFVAAFASAATAQTGPNTSRVTAITVTGTQGVGTFNGVAYVRNFGVVKGVIDPREAIIGLAPLPKNRAGQYEYASEFEIVAPAAGQPANEVMFVDSENRGNPVMLNLVNEAGVNGPPSRAVYRQGVGNGFLQRHATSYARVQWQTKFAQDVPETAQGVGLVIMRDFARLLAGTSERPAGAYSPGPYAKLILGGKSQSAWFVDVFIAEGFNVDPLRGNGVFHAALAVDGIGHFMALNTLAAERGLKQMPYIGPDALPLQHHELLRRPASDPILIDTVAYTDFYRLRASLTDTATTTPKYRRYDIPAAHAPQTPPVGPDAFADCNNGAAIPLNPISMSPFVRAQLIAAEKAIGVAAAAAAPTLPPSAVFQLGPAPASRENFNPLAGTALKVPLMDANAMPLGGVRFPDADYPLGKPQPASLAPVVTTSIDTTCGNRGGFQPFTKAELATEYGSKEKYLALYRQGLQKLVGQGFLLAEDETGMLAYAGYLWDNAENYLSRN